MTEKYKPNQFVRVPNWLIDLLIESKMKMREIRVLIFICIKTIGWDKQSDWMTRNYIAKNIGLNPNDVSRAISVLLAKKLLTRVGIPGAYRYSLSTQGVSNRTPRWVSNRTHNNIHSLQHKRLLDKKTRLADRLKMP